MNNFEKLQSMSIDELVEWIDVNIYSDGAIWWEWFDENYCDKCESEIIYIDDYFRGPNTEHKCAYCEVHNKCRFFSEMDDIPDNKEVIKMWLEAEVEE